MECVRIGLQQDGKSVNRHGRGADLFANVCDCDATETIGLKTVLRVHSAQKSHRVDAS